MSKLIECSQLCVLKRACMFVFGTSLLMFHSFHRVPTSSKWHPQYEFNENGKYVRELGHTPLPSNNTVGCWASCLSPSGFGPYWFHWLLWWDNREFCRTVLLQMWKLHQTGMEGLEKNIPAQVWAMRTSEWGCKSNFLGQNNANLTLRREKWEDRKRKMSIRAALMNLCWHLPQVGFYLSGRNLIWSTIRLFFFLFFKERKKENIFLIVAAKLLTSHRHVCPRRLVEDLNNKGWSISAGPMGARRAGPGWREGGRKGGRDGQSDGEK